MMEEPLSREVSDNPENRKTERAERSPGNSHSHGQSSEFYYEEITSGLTCPTCRGTGRIPRSQEGELVALIPYRDKRLKPRRTCLWVTIAVTLCLITGGLLVFFLFPREISAKQNQPLTQNVSITENLIGKDLNLVLETSFNVTNNNFVNAKVIKIVQQILFYDEVITSVQSSIDTSISPLKSQLITVPVSVTFKDNDFALLVCDPNRKAPPQHSLLMEFQSTVTAEFLSHPEDISVLTYQYVNCLLSTVWKIT